MSCPQTLCLLTTLNNNKGTMDGSYEAAPVFVTVWKKTHPAYVSPYTSVNTNSSRLRLLSTANNQIQSAIMCIQPNNAVSFQISSAHFPVYVKNSLYNSNMNFDAGLFDILETSIINSNVNISTFMFTFVTSGVYVFGDYQNIEVFQTIVKVSSSCSNATNIYPLTEQNLQLLGIEPNQYQMGTLP